METIRLDVKIAVDIARLDVIEEPEKYGHLAPICSEPVYLSDWNSAPLISQVI